MLADDAKYSMPPLPEWYLGQAAIQDFLVDGPMRTRWRFLPVHANGQLAFGTYMWDDAKAAYLPAGIDVLSLSGRKITAVVSFLTADFTRFGLPDRLRIELP